MNASNQYQNQHQEVELLLPWFVNNTLQGADLLKVENHIRDCLTCRRDLIALRKLSANIQGNSELDIAAASSFARLNTKMTTPARSNPARSARRRWGMEQRNFRFAAAASLILAAVLPILLPKFTDINQQYATLSADRAVTEPSSQLRVVFAKTASSSEIEATLALLHAQAVGDANSIGAINLRLDPEQGSPEPAQALAMLRNNPAVILAEPVLQP